MIRHPNPARRDAKVIQKILNSRQSVARKIKAGQEVTIWTPGNEKPIKAQVSSIAPVIAPATETVQVRCRIVEKTMPGNACYDFNRTGRGW